MTLSTSRLSRLCNLLAPPAVLVDRAQKIVGANGSFLDALGVPFHNLDSCDLFEAPNRQWNGAELQSALDHLKSRDASSIDVGVNTSEFECEFGVLMGRYSIRIELVDLDENILLLIHGLPNIATSTQRRFYSVVNHEIRTPLTSVLGFIDLALARSISTDVRDDLLSAARAARTLANRLSQLQRDEPLNQAGPASTVSANESQTSNLSVLLAEDTRANQKVIRRLLEMRNHQVTLADNGAAALDLVKTQKFDIVLMDMEMPIMNGATTTARIRELDAANKTRTTIIALTANSAELAKQECLDAGMDGFLSKPIDLDELDRALRSLPKPAAKGIEADASSSCTGIPFNLEATMKRLQGNRALFHEFIDVFNEDAPALLDQVEKAVQAEDPKTASQFAHRLRGLISNFTDAKAGTLAETVESATKKPDALSRQKAVLPQLASALAELQSALGSVAR